MFFLNHIVNPVVRVVLRSPLHRILSGGLVVLTVTGRRSGRRFSFPVGYEQRGDALEIRVGAPDRKRWWRNVTGAGAPVEVLLRGAPRTGRAVASGDEHSGVAVEVRLDPQR